MRYFILLTLLFTGTVLAQQYVQKQDTQYINLLTNAGFESGLSKHTYSSLATVAVTSDVTKVLEGSASLVFTPSVSNQVVSTNLYQTKTLSGTPCVAEVSYSTTETTSSVTFRVVTESSTVLATKELDLDTKKRDHLFFTCPSESIQIQLVSLDAVTNEFVFDGLYLGNRKPWSYNNEGISYTKGKVSVNTDSLLGAMNILNTETGADPTILAGIDVATKNENYSSLSGLTGGYFNNRNTVSGATISYNFGQYVSLDNQGEDSTFGLNYPLGLLSTLSASATVSEMGAIYSDTTIDKGNVSNFYGIKLITEHNTDAVVDNLYQFYLSAPSTSATTDNYAIYQDGWLPNYFGGSITTDSLADGLVNSVSGKLVNGIADLTTDVGSTILPTANGGTGQSTYSTGDLLVGSGTTLVKKAKGSAGQILKVGTDNLEWAALPSNQGGTNMLLNPDFELSVTTDWNSSGITLGQQSYTTASESNLKYASATATVGTSYTTAVKNIPTFMQGTDCEAVAKYTMPSGSFDMVVYTSGTVVASQTLSASTSWRETPKIFFPCGSTTAQLRFINTSAGTLTLDDVYMGSIKSLKTGAIIGPWQSYTPTFAALGTVTAIKFKWRQVGSSIEVIGTATAGTVTGSAATFTLPNNFTSTLDAPTVVGIYGTQSTAGSQYPLVYNNANNTIFFGSSNWQIPQTGTNVGTSSFISVHFTIPIVGLQATGVSFDSACPNDIACTNEFSAKISSTGVVSAEGLDWINGNCSGSAPFSCLFNAGVFSSAPNCVATVTENTDKFATVFTISTAGVSVGTYNSSAASSSGAFILKCTRSTDYKAKQTITGYFSDINQYSRLENYTPTITGCTGNSDLNAKWREDKDTINIIVEFTCGTSAATALTVSLPPGKTFANYAAGTIVGWAMSQTAGVQVNPLATTSSNSILYFSRTDSGNSGVYTQNANNVVSSGNRFTFNATVRKQ